MERPAYNVNNSTARISFFAHELLDDHVVVVGVVAASAAAVVVVSVDAVDFSCNVMAHGDAREGK
jgi:ribosomal protein L18E